jgi:hypothetical protein
MGWDGLLAVTGADRLSVPPEAVGAFSCCLVEAAACKLIRLALRRLRMSVVRPAVLHAVTPVLGVVDLERLASALGSFKS